MLKVSEILEAHALDEIPFCVLILESNAHCVYANKRALTVLGRTSGQIIGKNLRDFLGEAEAQMLITVTNDCLRTGSEQKASMPAEINGKKYFFDGTAIPIKAPDSAKAQVMFVCHDISDQVRRQEILNNTNFTLNKILDKMPVAFLALDENFEVSRINEAAIEMFGYQPKEVIGKSVDVFLQESMREKYRLLMREFAASSEKSLEAPNREEIKGRRKDGSEIPFYGSMVKISGTENDFYCAMLVDLTKMRQIENELDTVQKQLMQTQKHEALGHLAGNIAHDFNNMLAVISGYADLLDFEVSDAAQRSQMLSEIRRAVQRGSGLTGQILAYAKGPLINMKIHDLHEVIEGLRGMLHTAAGSGVQIEYKLGAERRRVQLDETQFTQVLLNLAVNARDAMPGAGKITIATTVIELHEEYFDKIGVTPAPGEYLKLSVDDTGSGIPENVVGRIFDPYFSTKGRDKGTGLGLAVVYGIIKKHKGFIFCTSKENVGTQFSIYLPLSGKDTGLEDIASKSGPSQILSLEAAKIEILIVEDEENLRQILARQLSTAGFLVHTASNGREGLDFIDNFPGKLSIVLTDISMPEMTGLDMASEARLLQPDASFLFMTGNAMALENGKAIGNIRVLKKPFNNEALMAEINGILAERQELNLG